MSNTPQRGMDWKGTAFDWFPAVLATIGIIIAGVGLHLIYQPLLYVWIGGWVIIYAIVIDKIFTEYRLRAKHS